jgi:hypothetical protein
LEEDQADVMTTAFTIEGMALMPAAEATSTKGLCVASPDWSLRRGSSDATIIPTIRTVVD